MAKTASKYKAEDLWLTTKDNVYNPFTNYDEWHMYDTDAYAKDHPAYCTEAYWMRELGLRNPDDYSIEALVDELLPVFEEIITINNEMGLDIYQIITREGERLDHVPPEFLYSTTKSYVTPREGGPENTPTP